MLVRDRARSRQAVRAARCSLRPAMPPTLVDG